MPLTTPPVFQIAGPNFESPRTSTYDLLTAGGAL